MMSALFHAVLSEAAAFCGIAMMAVARRSASSCPRTASSRNWTRLRIRSRTFMAPSFSGVILSAISRSIVAIQASIIAIWLRPFLPL